jgi:hypothetical protein
LTSSIGDRGPANTRAANSKRIPCLRKCLAASMGSQSNFVATRTPTIHL